MLSLDLLLGRKVQWNSQDQAELIGAYLATTYNWVNGLTTGQVLVGLFQLPDGRVIADNITGKKFVTEKPGG